MQQATETISVGDQFGFLTVVSESFIKHSKKHHEVMCGCGTKNEVSVQNLMGETISCGCMTGERNLPITNLPRASGKYLRNNKLFVFKKGDIFRVKGNFFFECTEINTGKNGKYKVITLTENGQQKHLYVHRLLAEAFIPNPENKPQINHIDGNPSNNDLDNLEWVTAQENVQHAYDTGLVPTLENSLHKCTRCFNPTMDENEFCQDCKYHFKTLKNKLQSNQKQRDEYRNIKTEELGPRYKKIIKSRFRGDTLEEIGDRLGVSRERVRQLINDVKSNDPSTKTSEFLNPTKEKETEKLFKITLEAARVNVKKTINEVSSKLNKSPATIRNWEKGKNKIPIEQFETLARMYSIPLENISYSQVGKWVILK